MKMLHHLVCIKKNVHHGHIQIFILNLNEFMKSGQETNICIQGYHFYLPKLGLLPFQNNNMCGCKQLCSYSKLFWLHAERVKIIIKLNYKILPTKFHIFLFRLVAQTQQFKILLQIKGALSVSLFSLKKIVERKLLLPLFDLKELRRAVTISNCS